jgi:SET domain-containing protein 6
MYHVMGSLLLSRSFTIKDEIAQDVQTRGNEPEEVGNPIAMKMDDSQGMSQDPESLEVNDSDDEEEEEVVVLPLADMLNARYGHDNVCFPLDCRTE